MNGDDSAWYDKAMYRFFYRENSGHLFINTLGSVVNGKPQNDRHRIVFDRHGKEHRVFIYIIVCAANFKMDMRCLGAAGISAVGDQLPFFHWEQFRGDI